MDPLTTVAAASWLQRYWKPLAVAVAAALASVVTLAVIVLGAAFGMFSSTSDQQLMALTCSTQAGPQPAFGRWNATQMTNAGTIVAVGQAQKVPVFGEIVAVAASMQESQLINLPGGGQDSAGLFQERPSQGWGTHAQVMQPVYASTQFYRRLVMVKGWQQMPLTQAAQAVERSGHPGAYAKWQSQASAVVSRVAGPGQCSTTSMAVPNKLVATVIAFARQQLGKPYQWGGTGPGAFDCSGLVMMAYHAAGVTIPRTSEEQWAWGPNVSAGHEEPGDLVFFAGSDGTATNPGHVGLVIGRNSMVEAYATGFPIRVSTFGQQSSAPGDQVVVGFTRPWSRFSS